MRASSGMCDTQSLSDAVRVAPIDEKLEHLPLAWAQQGGLQSNGITNLSGPVNRSVENLRGQYCVAAPDSVDGVEEYREVAVLDYHCTGARFDGGDKRGLIFPCSGEDEHLRRRRCLAYPPRSVHTGAVRELEVHDAEIDVDLARTLDCGR